MYTKQLFGQVIGRRLGCGDFQIFKECAAFAAGEQCVEALTVVSSNGLQCIEGISIRLSRNRSAAALISTAAMLLSMVARSSCSHCRTRSFSSCDKVVIAPSLSSSRVAGSQEYITRLRAGMHRYFLIRYWTVPTLIQRPRSEINKGSDPSSAIVHPGVPEEPGAAASF